MAALTMHIDDSGTHNGTANVTLAGFIADYGNWRKFSRDWDKACKEFHISGFHASEFMASNPKSDFAGWDESRKISLLKRLRFIADAYAMKGFAMSVNKAEYDELAVGDIRKKLGEFPYTFALRCALGFVEQWREQQDIREPIEYIFDWEGETRRRSEIDNVFEIALKEEDDPLHRYGVSPGCHSFRKKSDILPLQAADLLAYCVYQRDCERITHRAVHPLMAETFNFFKNRSLTAKFMTRESLAGVIAHQSMQ